MVASENRWAFEGIDRAFISHAVLDERFVLRLAVGQLRTTADDVRRAWDVLRREAV